MSQGIDHGGAPRGWLEFSANLNPLGVPPQVAEAVARATYTAYADTDTAAAERHLAEDAGVAPDHVLLTAGATEALRLAIDASMDRGDRAIALGPTYGEFARLVRARGAALVEIRAKPPSFVPPVSSFMEALAAGRPAVAFVCEPNNPTGAALGASELGSVVAALPERTRLIIDGSFAAFASDEMAPREIASHPNVILVRSLTKVLAAPGLRIGYVIAHPEVLRTLRSLRDPWSVGAHAVAAAAAASWRLDGEARATIARWRDELGEALTALGLTVAPSDAPFLLAHIGPDAPALVRALAERRIAVRGCASFGLPEHVRVAVRAPEDQTVLLAAIRAARVKVAP